MCKKCQPEERALCGRVPEEKIATLIRELWSDVLPAPRRQKMRCAGATLATELNSRIQVQDNRFNITLNP